MGNTFTPSCVYLPLFLFQDTSEEEKSGHQQHHLHAENTFKAEMNKNIFFIVQDFFTLPN